jgi:hypothetical protein
MSLIGRTRRHECPEHGPPEKPGHYARCPECRGALVWVECVVVPTTTYQGAVSDRDALAKHLEYALDALEGKPWTGWNTDDARAILSRARGQYETSDDKAPDAIGALLDEARDEWTWPPSFATFRSWLGRLSDAAGGR